MGIYRENLEKSAVSTDFGCRILLKTLSNYAKFPKQQNRELNPPNRESKFALQGFDRARTGNAAVAAKKARPSEPKTCIALALISEDRQSIFGGESIMTAHQTTVTAAKFQRLERNRPSGSKTCTDVTLVSEDPTPMLRGERP